MIYVLGTAAGGGIANVIGDHCTYYKHRNLAYKRITTHLGISKFQDIFLFLKSLYLVLAGCLKKDVDFIHLHMSYNGSFWRKFSFLLIGLSFNVKVIIHLHGSEFHLYVNSSSKFRKKAISFLIRKCYKFLVLSSGWKDFVLSVSDGPVQILPNFIDVDFSSLDNTRDDDFVYIGALIDRKDPLILIRAFFESKHRGHLHICGDGPLMKRCVELVKSLDLTSKVTFHGWVDREKKFQLLNKCNYLVLPSHNEGFPLTVIEAMAKKCLVISTPVGAISEYIRNGENGILFQPGDLDSLTEILRNISNFNREEIINNALVTYKNNFTKEIAFRILDKIYGVVN